MAGRDNSFDMQIKLLMIGDSGVGKTCLLLRYANDSFSPTFITTIGIDFKIKNIQLESKRIKLQVMSYLLTTNWWKTLTHHYNSCSFNTRFGTPLAKRDSELLQLLTSEERKESCWSMMSQIGKHSYLYATGWPKYKWYRRTKFWHLNVRQLWCQ